MRSNFDSFDIFLKSFVQAELILKIITNNWKYYLWNTFREHLGIDGLL